jgi:hypothetical protein
MQLPNRTSLTVLITILAGKHAGGDHHAGVVTAFANSIVEISTALKLERLSNLKIQIYDTNGKSITDQLYGKVTIVDTDRDCFQVQFTSTPPEAKEFFLRLTEQIAPDSVDKTD